VSKQLADLVKDPPEGIKVMVNDEDISSFSAVIDGPAGTPYFGGTFYVRLCLSKDFPQSPPKAFFVTKIFHPNVSRDGEICVNTLKKDWKPDLGLKHVLLTIKCLLIVPNPESALNEEAGKLLLEDYDDYCRRAKMMTEIHARVNQMKETGNKSPAPDDSDDGPQAKKFAGDKASDGRSSGQPSTSSSASSNASTSNPNTKKTISAASRDKRRTLKRL